MLGNRTAIGIPRGGVRVVPRHGVLAWMLFAGAGAFCACGEDAVAPNLAPETSITATPPQLGATGSEVAFAWQGTDPDGGVTRYQWRISDNGSDAMIDPADTLLLAWNSTSAIDSTFHVSANLDSFTADVLDPPLPPEQLRYWQTHTLFVRAVDDRGAVDPTPASVSFTATTLAPTVTITAPRSRGDESCSQGSMALTLRWSATDPDAEAGAAGLPYATRTLLWELPACVIESDFARDNPIAAAPAEAWSPWVAYDAAADGPGRSRTFAPLEVGSVYLFAVQAIDRAGAVSPAFVWERNVRHMQVLSGLSPRLTVTEASFGLGVFVETSPPVSGQLIKGHGLGFSWSADAAAYLGTITGYRYGWDIADVADPADPGWEVDWGTDAAHRSSTWKVLAPGSHNFVVVARDDAGSLVAGRYLIDVLDAPPRSQQRPVLLVKDWPHGSTPTEMALHANWAEQWRSLLVRVADSFDPVRDVVDVYATPNEPNVQRIVEYRSVIWFTKGTDSRTAFHRFLAPRDAYNATNLNAYHTAPFNWVNSYQQSMGNLLFVGPATMFATIEWDGQLMFPAVFAAPCYASPFGRELELPDGSRVSRGTVRFPYVGFCLESLDFARPNPGTLYGEQAGAAAQQRTRECDTLVRALVDEEFLSRYPSAQGSVVPLEPLPVRTNPVSNDSQYLFRYEEFYNADATSCPATLTPRTCQQTMFRWLARRDAGYIARPDTTCPPYGRARSHLDGMPAGVLSTVYSAAKPIPGSVDAVWGFHPLGFDSNSVGRALDWLARESWQLGSF